MKLVMSNHASKDREDRFMSIINKGIDIGEIFCRCQHKDYADREEILTTTGILLVVAKDSNILITGYICSIDKASAVYKRAKGLNSKLPKSMKDKIEKNNRIIKK